MSNCGGNGKNSLKSDHCDRKVRSARGTALGISHARNEAVTFYSTHGICALYTGIRHIWKIVVLHTIMVQLFTLLFQRCYVPHTGE